MALAAIAPAAAPKRLNILGSTGSIGQSTLSVVAEHPERFTVQVLTAQNNVELLAQQAKQVRAKMAVIGDENHYRALQQLLSGTGIGCAAGRDALIQTASEPAECTVAGIVGAAGLEVALAAIGNSDVLALANKECLVCAGEVFMQAVAASHTRLIPVDSEHSAIFQVLNERQRDQVEAIVLTASGGPFWQRPVGTFHAITPEEAVAHPNWKMGAKISVDSATMMNKGLELIEAYYLFGVEESRLSALIHPESIVHSLVYYADGSVLAQLGTPDMRTPIAVSLAWPERMSVSAPRLDLAALGSLTFTAPDYARFPLLKLAQEALKQKGASLPVLNAANEEAVSAFLDRRIGFENIHAVVAQTLARLGSVGAVCTLEAVRAIDEEARICARAFIARL